MQGDLVTRRTQFSSCDECRRSRVACDAVVRAKELGEDNVGDVDVICSRCERRKKSCTFKWVKENKTATAKKASKTAKGKKSRQEKRELSMSDSALSIHQHELPDEVAARPASIRSSNPSDWPSPFGHLMQDNAAGSFDMAISPASNSVGILNPEIISALDSYWLSAIYQTGFDSVFGSWMGRFCNPFATGEHSRADKYVRISDLCGKLDQWMASENRMPDHSATSPRDLSHAEMVRDRQIDESLRMTIVAFSARWLPLVPSSSATGQGRDRSASIEALWRHARRDMLRVINRPSYRSMLTLFLFALTPIPSSISEDEELDGISGQSCVHAALQQIQILRARHRNLQFSGSKVSPFSKRPPMPTSPDSLGTSDFMMAESTAHWAALTFDTSASLTLNSRSLLSSGLFGYDEELSWRLVRSSAKMFVETSHQWLPGSIDIDDDRANRIVGAAAAWKLWGWKLTAVFKEALRDGHEEDRVQNAFAAVVESIQYFNVSFRPHLEACQRRMHFLNQDTRLRWYSLMLHYHLSILMLVDIVEATERFDLMANLKVLTAEAENTVMDTLVFGLNSMFTLSINPNSALAQGHATSITVPLTAVDPYPHHIVAAMQLVRKAIERDYSVGKITPDSYATLRATMEKTLDLLPQSSKSIQAAKVRQIEGEHGNNPHRPPPPQAWGRISRLSDPLIFRRCVSILGAGTQGRRLAFMWSSQGQDVHLIDAQPSQLQASIGAVEELRASWSAKGSATGKIVTHLPDELGQALQSSWLVVECVPERLPLKKKILQELDSVAPEDVIVASNSSSYSCGEIIKDLDLTHKSRILSAHTYWPPETPAIEIMSHETTDQAHVQLMLDRCAAHGFEPFHVRKPSMGYLYNRIWAAIKREALLAASEGAGTPEEIDAIFRGILKTAKGPFELMDVVGLDVVYDIEQHYAEARADVPEEPRQYLKNYLDRGDLGVKSGKGFYEHARKDT
ncbi:putative 3-hydroxyacyl-CoA dehydrogenase [Emericellopsis atlantica]|uniref:3-hydroxyacyl-CoA dehydrogenase n=1 Tax=Emericellopsis atlantica TaxID=2614577 RepID=A0A9P7ZS03_9HYPO|nr:putative 3-hydroxyacyl-CoA dehydrogenase [Emericellopsis atlantica]KAG9256777.1 putative 3-hydroxyacyl-CoA dehydrogenase [Emericellopsis atlantica]